jgi:hypothetical protein
MVDPMDDIIQWDNCGHDSGSFVDNSDVRRVGNRNEPDPEKWLPGDPFGPASDRYQ